MKILAFAASNSQNSINRALVTYAAERFASEMMPSAQITYLDLNDFEMPIYSSDREKADGVPAPAQAFFDKIGEVDAVFVSFAEHNGAMTAAWKNVFDWVSRIDMQLWHKKPVVMLAATPGPRAGAGVLGGQTMIAPFFGAELVGSYGVGKWSEAWDADKSTLTRDEDIAAIDELLKKVAA